MLLLWGLCEIVRLEIKSTSALRMSEPKGLGKAVLAQPADEKSVPSHLRCNSCSKPVFNPYQTPHGCRMCQPCVSTKLHPTDKRQCPGNTEACKDEDEEILICQATCTPDIATRLEIGKLNVTCPNKDDGCKEQFKWKDVDTHLEKCNYEKVNCNQCGDPILKKNLTSHKSDECRQRQEKCDLCSLMVIYSELDKSHKNLDSPTCCSNYKSHCPYCKDKSRKFDRHSFADHLRTCPEKPNICKYSHLGCELKARKSELERHYREDTDHHLSLMDSKLRQLGTAASAQVVTGAATAPAFTGDSREVEEVKRKVTNIHEHFKKLQVNVANWAHTTLEFEQMADKFGGISQMRTFLKNLDDKMRQMDSSAGSGGDVGRRGAGGPGVPGVIESDSPAVQQKLNEIEFRLLNLEITNYDGFLVWKVNNLTKRRREAVDKTVPCIFSQQFFGRRNGFMFRVRLFLNGNESGEGSHVSVYLVLMQHELDDIQEWPLRASVSFRLVNLKNRGDDITKTVRFDTGSQRPSSREDLSLCCGEAKFLSINQLESSNLFVKNDCLFLEVEVTEIESGQARRSQRR